MTEILIGWIAAVAIVFVVAARPWWSPAARHIGPWIIGLAAAGLSLWRGALLYSDAIADGAYTGATLMIPLVPVKSAVLGQIAYWTVRAIMAAASSSGAFLNRWGLAMALSALSLALVVSESLDALTDARVRTAKSTTLTPTQITEIVGRVTTGQAPEDERLAFLTNPVCPPDLLTQFAGGSLYERATVASNPSTPTDVLIRLSQDESSEVRVPTVTNPGLPTGELPRLAADSDPVVRRQTVWKEALPDADFRRLLNDPDAEVRNAVAYQRKRLTDDELRALLRDPSDTVRATATREAGWRGIE